LSQDSKGAALIGTITNSVEANSEAVGQLFSELNRLNQESSAGRLADSLQIMLGKEIKDSLPDLKAFRLSRISFFDAQNNSAKFGWEASLIFSKRQNTLVMNDLKQRLRRRLSGDTLVFTVNL